MASKRITTELVIKGTDQYSGMIRNMSGVTGRFASKVRTEMGRMQGMRGPLRMIDDFRRQQKVVRGSADALDAANEKTRKLLATIRATKNPAAAMRREFERARATSGRLEEKHRRNRAELRGLQGQMQSAGVDTSDLAGEQRRLTSALDAANGKFARQAERMQRLKTMQDRIAEGRERMQRSLATAANLSFVGNASMQTGRRILTGMTAPIMRAVEFESAMSDVRKVVDFESPAAFKEMSEDILLLSTKVPMSTSALAMLAATGGQLGIARADLMDFSIQAAKIGIAFDISAEQAASSLGTMQNALGLTLADSGKLFDAMNFVSNNSAARADQTLEFLNRAGASGQTFGFDPAETLAIGSAMIAAGAGADTAATSFRNMGRALTKGESATKRQGAAFGRLGLDASVVARKMQEDAVGTTQDVLQRLSSLPEHLRASTMSDLFGDEARELTKLLNNMQLMPDMLAMVADETQYLGSAEAEYAERAKTTANNMQLLRNQSTRLGISIGEVVLPPLNELLSKSQVFIDKLVTWTKENPKLTKSLVMGGIALGGMAVAGGFFLTAAAGLIGTMAVLRFGLVGLGARAAFASGGLTSLLGGFGGLGKVRKFRMARMISPLTWGATLIPPIPWRKLIAPLSWVGRGALRFIPVIGWAVLAGELSWHLLIKPMGWDAYIPGVNWKSFLGAFSWEDGIPVIDWSVFLSSLNWSDAARNFEWSEFVSKMDWKRFITTISPAAFVSRFLWKNVISRLDWRRFVGKLLWGETIRGFEWGDYISKFQWRQVLTKVSPAVFISRFLWKNVIDPIEWKSWFTFKWQDFLPDWSWDFIPELNLTGLITWPKPPEWLSWLKRGASVPAGSAGRREGRVQERASGGEYGPGPLVVGERGPELRFPTRSGFIATTNQMQRLQRSAQRVRATSLAALASTALVGSVATVSAATPSVIGAGGGRSGVTVNINGSITIPVPAGVTNPHAIAEITAELLGQRVDETFAASFSD